jgi:uncharacterized repeat protein (TIGR04076 family)
MAGPNGTTVRVEIIEIMGSGVCSAGLKVGQSWVVSDDFCPEGICAWAFQAMMPFISALRFGGRFPWSGERTARVCCPDADNPVVFRVTAEA